MKKKMHHQVIIKVINSICALKYICLFLCDWEVVSFRGEVVSFRVDVGLEAQKYLYGSKMQLYKYIYNINMI